MVARFTAASLGLLAFAVTLVAGVIAQNPFTVTLSRGILALFIFCILGAVVGHAAQAVVMEREKLETQAIDERFKKEVPGADTAVVASTGDVQEGDVGVGGALTEPA